LPCHCHRKAFCLRSAFGIEGPLPMKRFCGIEGPSPSKGLAFATE
jgi:hypothetical protein